VLFSAVFEGTEGTCIKSGPVKFGATVAPNGDKAGLECAQHLPDSAPVPASVNSSTFIGFWVQDKFPSAEK